MVQGGTHQLAGIVQSKDLLAASFAGQPFDLRAALHPPLFLPNTVMVLRALEVFKTSGEPMALVVDEYGDLEGLVDPDRHSRGAGRRHSGPAKLTRASSAARTAPGWSTACSGSTS